MFPKKKPEKKQSNSVQLKPLPQKKSAIDKKLKRLMPSQVTNEEMPKL